MVLRSITLISLMALIVINTGCASPVSTVSATPSPAKNADVIAAKPNTTKRQTIRLRTGQVATLTGGVFIKTDDVDGLLVWAKKNGYEATKDRYSSGTVHIASSPADSIAIAKVVVKVPGVSKAEPNYSVPMVKK